MLAFNRPHLIGRAIQSILMQDYRAFELIVVHDGPNNQLEDIMREWVNRDSRIRYFRRSNSGNIANALNFGLRHARGEYVAILDDDDYWLTRQKLGLQVTFLDTHSGYVGCGGGMIIGDETGKELLRCFKPRDDASIKERALVANPIMHSTSMFRRHLAGRFNLYDDSLSGFQDWDFWLTLGRLGKLYNFSELFTWYTVWEGSSSFRRSRENARSAMRIVWRHQKAYGYFPLALALPVFHYLYTYVPTLVRSASFSFLARIKKTMFSSPAP